MNILLKALLITLGIAGSVAAFGIILMLFPMTTMIVSLLLIVFAFVVYTLDMDSDIGDL